MSIWNRNYGEGGDVDWLSYPPESGGWFKISAFGFALPLYLIYIGISDWINLRASIPSKSGPEMVLTGSSAQAVAVVCFGAALFCHARWFWGLKSSYTIFERLTTLASLTMIGGIAAAFWLGIKGSLW